MKRQFKLEEQGRANRALIVSESDTPDTIEVQILCSGEHVTEAQTLKIAKEDWIQLVRITGVYSSDFSWTSPSE